MLTHGDHADCLGERLRLSESSLRESLKRFCGSVVEKFPQYLKWCPTVEEKEQALGPRGSQDTSAPGTASTNVGGNVPL